MSEGVFLLLYTFGIVVTGMIILPDKGAVDTEILGWAMLSILFPIYWAIRGFIFIKELINEYS